MDIRVLHTTAHLIKVRILLRSASAMLTRGTARLTIAALVSTLIGFSPAVVAPAAAGPLAAGLYNLQIDFYNGTITPLVAPVTDGTPCGTYLAAKIHFWWAEGSPDNTTCNSNYFSAHGTATIVAPFTGDVTFCTASDDGMYLNIGPSFSMGDWAIHPPVDCDSTAVGEPNIATMSMVAGQSYSLSLWYREAQYGAGMAVLWKYNGGAWSVIPGSTTITVTPAGSAGTVTSSDGVIDCDWDGSTATGTCSETTSGSVTLTATPANVGDLITWSDDCAGAGNSPTCTPSGSMSSTAVGVSFRQTCASVSRNIVANCSFETGDFTNWTTNGDIDEIGVFDWYPETGDYSFWDSSTSSAGVSQVLTTIPGRTYDVSFRLFGGGNPANFSAALGSTTLLNKSVSTIDFEWTEYTYTYTATGTSTTLTFAASTPFYWSVDEVVVALRKANVSVSYSGDQLVVGGGGATAVALKGTVSPVTEGCLLHFVVTDGVGAPAGNWDATTNSSGVATVSPTQSFSPGAYEVAVSLTGNCTGAADETGAFVVSMPGDKAYGGGWYSQPGRTNFGFEVHPKSKVNPISYTGQLVWGYKNRWRFKGTLNSYSVTTIGGIATGVSSGTGTLFWWDSTLNDGLGGWAVAGTGVNVTIRFQQTVTGKKSSFAGAFGITIGYTRSGSQPSLPASDLVLLKGGGIKLT